MPLHPIVTLANGRIDSDYEREIATLWFNEKRIEWVRIEDTTRKGFYFLKKRKRSNKVYICCSSNIASRKDEHFWFGFEKRYIQANPDIGLILICVWENKVREYICLPNSFVRLWTNYWYFKNDYYSISINVKHGKYLMKYPKDYVFIDEYVDTIDKIFEKIDFLQT